MIIPDTKQTQSRQQPSELRIVAEFLERVLNREVKVNMAMPEINPQITVQPAAIPEPVRQWRFEFERDRFGRTTAITAIAQ